MAKRYRGRAPKKSTPNNNLGLNSQALDYFSNPAARMGWGTPSLPEATEYTMVRLSNNYWLMLTLYRNHWIARRVVDLPAQDMTRAWAHLSCDVSPDDIAAFDRTIKKTYTPNRVRQALKWARLYGGAGALIAINGHEDILEEPLDLDEVAPGSYRGLIPFDRWAGISPGATRISQDLNRPADWGLPEYYECHADSSATSFKVHSSRILRFLGPEVPTPEFQAQVYWGISVIEVIWEELRKRDNASFAILNLLYRANIIARKDPDLQQLLSGLGVSQEAQRRWAASMQAQNELLSSQSMLIMGKDSEMQSVQYSFAGVGELYAQYQMDVSGASEIPVTRLFGRTVTGLGQSNDADERYYEERIAQEQDGQVGPQLDKLYPVICMSQFGEVPPDLDFTFPSIRVLSEEEKGDIVEKVSAPVLAAYNSGVTGRKTTLMELKRLGDTTEAFTNISQETINEADDEPMMPGEGNESAGGGGGVNPDRAERKESAGAES